MKPAGRGILLLVLGVLAGRSEGRTLRQLPSSNFVGEGTNDLTVSMLQNDVGEKRNYVFSPLGYSAILAILAEGARGNTRNQLVAALRLPEDTYAVRNTYKKLLTSMQERWVLNKPEFKNWFYVYRNYSVEESYKEVLSENYLTEVRNIELDLWGSVEEEEPEDLVAQEKKKDSLDTKKEGHSSEEEDDEKKDSSEEKKDSSEENSSEEKKDKKSPPVKTDPKDDKKGLKESEDKKEEEPKVEEVKEEEKEKKKEEPKEEEKETKKKEEPKEEEKETKKKEEPKEEEMKKEEPKVEEEEKIKEEPKEAEKEEPKQEEKEMKKKEEPKEEEVKDKEEKKEEKDMKKEDKDMKKDNKDMKKDDKDTKKEEKEIKKEGEEEPRSDSMKGMLSALSANKLCSVVKSETEKNPKSRMIVFNGLYFKGNWSVGFRSREEAPFYTTATDKKPVKTMEATGEFDTGEIPDLDATAIEIPYKGDRYSLMVLLPNSRDGLTKLTSDLTGYSFRSIDRLLSKKEVQLCLPKFKFYTVTHPKQALIKSGVSDIFDEAADLSGISGEKGLYLDDLVQLVTLEVDEGDSKTNFLSSTKIMTRSNPGKFSVDRPFLFFLRDRVDNLVVVAGKVVDPTVGN